MARDRGPGCHPRPDGLSARGAGGRVDRIRELKRGRQEVETVWIITSLTAAQADKVRLLQLARQYWSIENGTHYPLDVSAGEDRCRVHQPVAATVLGILRRAVQGEARPTGIDLATLPLVATAWHGRKCRGS